jgi:hypothetical protein
VLVRQMSDQLCLSGVRSYHRSHSVKLGTSVSLSASFFVAAGETEGQLYLLPAV